MLLIDCFGLIYPCHFDIRKWFAVEKSRKMHVKEAQDECSHDDFRLGDL